jgi:hypothetical protein
MRLWTDGLAGLILETLSACIPILPWVASYVTLAPSSRVLKPLPAMLVHENVLVTLVRSDEAIPFLVGNHFYRSLGHVWSPPIFTGAPPQ